jgi:hypothetical protein
MYRKFSCGFVAGVSTFLLGLMVVGGASGATLKLAAEKGAAHAFVAIYGFPAVHDEAERPVGGGLGRDFSFGETMVFQAGNGVGSLLSMTINKEVLKARDASISLQLASNHTGANVALGFQVTSADLQDTFLGAAHEPIYADTTDVPWIGKTCSPSIVAGKCKVDPLVGSFAGEGAEPGEVKIEGVSFDVGPGTVIQGAIWGKWINGGNFKAPCIELHLPAALKGVSTETLYETQGAAVGKALEAIKGKACLISANNGWYSVKAEGEEKEEKEENAIEITNE